MTSRNKVWLITGTSSGFGRALTLDLIARGERVVATARDPRALDDLARLAPERVLALRLDVTQSEDVRNAVTRAIDKFGAVDVLVNNAGYSIVGAAEETSEFELRSALETMFFGAAAMTNAVLPHMRERRTGTIVQISSMGGFITAPGFSAYCAAKHALEGFSEALAPEVAPFGVRVLIVEPGAFRTSLFGGGFRTMPATAAYADTVGPTRAYVEQSAGSQPGDPAKAARAIIEAVDASAPTLRLPLGADAIQAIRAKLEQVTSDVNATEEVAKATTF